MAVHPPALYLGYVGFVVPFAFAMGSLITREPGEAWIHLTRRTTADSRRAARREGPSKKASAGL
jgi:cytochrome c biogenesis factor